MIQPQEIRIDNLFQDKFTKDVFKVLEISKNKIVFDYETDKIWQAEPIPLTEEILLKFGFEKIKSDEYPHKFIINKDMRDEVEIENLNAQNCFVFSHGKKFSSIKIEYVHQLQNLHFSLTGKELPF